MSDEQRVKNDYLSECIKVESVAEIDGDTFTRTGSYSHDMKTQLMELNEHKVFGPK